MSGRAFTVRLGGMKRLIALLAVAALAFTACADSDPDTAVIQIEPVADSSGITPTANLVDAAANVEQAHEGLANIWHHNGTWQGCGHDCSEAIGDAKNKTATARNELGADILSLTTWDHGQTVEHAFDAALYWIGVDTGEDVSTKHALYQLGILRDVLRGEVQKRQSPPSLDARSHRPTVRHPAADPTTSTANLVAANDAVEQAHEGLGNILKDFNTWTHDGCTQRCMDAIASAYTKTVDAHGQLGPDILGQSTWDHGHTVGDAFDSAQYWMEKGAFGIQGDIRHAEYQLGILRDVLRSAVDQRQNPPHPVLVGLGSGGCQNDCADIRQAASLIEAAHEGIGNLIKSNGGDKKNCGDQCQAAEQDAALKNHQAWNLTPQWLIDQPTWDKQQTLGHAYWAADYWISQSELYGTDGNPSDWEKAEYQLGIARDVLNAAAGTG